MKKTLLSIVLASSALLVPQLASASPTIEPAVNLGTANGTSDFIPQATHNLGGSFVDVYKFTTDSEFLRLYASATAALNGAGKGAQLTEITLTKLVGSSWVGVLSTGIVPQTSALDLTDGFLLAKNTTYELSFSDTVHSKGGVNTSISFVVPEPEQIAMFLLGLPLISWFARRKQAA